MILLRFRVAPALLTALFACFAISLAAPALASAASFVVDSAVDQADEDQGDGVCETAAETCTLRAALTEVNLSTDEANSIGFDPTVFDGEEQDTIFLGSTLPTIFQPVTIAAGSSCTTAGVVGAPCAGVTGVPGEPVFAVEADASSISGLAITSGSIGIGVFGESVGFTATGNWIGVPMSGTNDGNASAGIFLGPGSDDAQIGGATRVERNLIAHNEVGLDVEGASGATVRGNWFGPLQSGIDPERAEMNIEITDYKPLLGTESKAEDNEVGAAVDPASQTSAACDGGCNVIAGAGDDAVDLVGDGPLASEAPASGPTTIHGNYIGLDGSGTVVHENDESGIDASGAAGVTIGGVEAGEPNFFAGGTTGVSSEDGAFLRVIGNSFGVDGEGATVASPDIGTLISQSSSVDPEELAQINWNVLRMDQESIAIDLENDGEMIHANYIEGGEIGIRLRGDIWGGSAVEGNEIVAPEDVGILVGTPENVIFGNEVTASGEMGIEVTPDAEVDVSGNVIGGDAAKYENRIFDSDAFAILIRGVEESRNEVRRNRGSGNGGDGGFIVLRPYDPDGGDPNGVQSPTISAAAKTEASGEAEPGALVRVFHKASAEEGELAGFLGQAVADGSGQWKATYGPQPEGTMVVATQTLGGGTSSLSQIATTPPDPPAPPTCATTPSLCPNPPLPGPPAPGPAAAAPTPAPAPAADTRKPVVTVTKGPKAQLPATTAILKFVSDEAGSAFQCKLDKKAWAKCASPRTYKRLQPGKHVFKVKATDAAGNVSAVVTRKFTVTA